MDKGSKRHISWFWEWLEKQGKDVTKIKQDIELITVKTMMCAQPSIAHI